VLRKSQTVATEGGQERDGSGQRRADGNPPERDPSHAQGDDEVVR